MTMVANVSASSCENCSLVAAVLYLMEGLLLTTANMLILAAVLYHPQLRRRKEYLMVVALALVDGMGGVATLIGGVGRLCLVLFDDPYKLVSRLYCLSRPWNLLFIWTDPLAHIILLVISFDRLFAIVNPLKYVKLTHNYVFVVLGGVFAFWCINVLTGVTLTISYTQPSVGALCYMAWSVQPNYYLYYGTVETIADILGVGIYILILVIVRRTNKIYPIGSSAEQVNIHRQHRITVTLGLASLFTALFYTVPLLAKLIAGYFFSEDTMSMVLPFTFLINNLNQFANFFLYTTRQKEVQQGVIGFLKCRKIDV